ncbi:hypothetical protein CIK05_11890 [Bdellovibrio sp. qaytius]|nr:hypothetical protein CIK05_11890 [Bdellovibrio sp. qaytius]
MEIPQLTLFNLLNIRLPDLKPSECKIHTAVWNGRDNPLDVYTSGKFEEWQNEQNQKNFNKPFIISLIQMSSDNKWLFAGVYHSLGYKQDPNDGGYIYETKEVENFSDLNGRIVIHFDRNFRASYLLAENHEKKLIVSEIKEHRLTIESFPGFTNVLISKDKLDNIVNRNIESWKSPLSNVAGVYIITDLSNGKHYVGSAYGQGGFWARWSTYSQNGHGDNVMLKQLINEKGFVHSKNFQFSILETADTTASQDEILMREAHWKKVIHSRVNGYNAN